MTTFYVNQKHTRASDSNPGTLKLPFLTLGKANTAMANNDKVLVDSGVYPEAITVAHDGVTWEAIDNDVVVEGSSILSSVWTVYSGDVWQTPLAGTTVQNLFVDGELYILPSLSIASVTYAVEPHTLMVEGGFFHDSTAGVLYLHAGGKNPNISLIERGARASSFSLLSRDSCHITGFRTHRTSAWGVRIAGGGNNVVRAIDAWGCSAGGIRVEGLAASLFKPTDGGVGGTLPVGTYYYRVTAIVGGVETIPSPVQQITVAAGHMVSLSWSAVVGASQYYIYGRSANLGPPLVPTGTYLDSFVSALPFPVYLDDGSKTPTGTPPPYTSTLKTRANLIEDIDSWQTGSHGIAIFNASGNTVRNCLGHHNSTHGIALQRDASNNIVEENRCWDNWKFGTRTANGIQCDNFGQGTPGSPNNILQRNRLFRNQDSGISIYNDSDDCTARYNISYLNGDHGIDNLSAHRAHMIGNTVIGNVTAGLNSEGSVSSTQHPSLGSRMYNNISVNNGVHSPRTSGNYRVDTEAIADTQLDYNLSHLTIPADAQTIGSNAEIIFGPTSYKTLAGFRAAHPTYMQNGISVDPQFVDEVMNDYRIRSSSPAIGVGSPSAPDYQAPDFDGFSPARHNPNFGAYHRWL